MQGSGPAVSVRFLEAQESDSCWELTLVLELLAEGQMEDQPGFSASLPLSLYDSITGFHSLP